AFKETDCTVEAAATATEGLEFLSSQSPDLVLLDVMLPDLSGLEAFREIRRRDPRLPVIFITVSNDSDTAIEAVQDGAYDYLLKPLDLARVREVAHLALESRRRMNVPVTFSNGDGEPQSQDALLGPSPQIL